jgi:hypothetical protein
MEARTDGERDFALVVQARAATFARSLITHFDREFNVRARMARTIARSNITQHAACSAIERAQVACVVRRTSCAPRIVHGSRNGPGVRHRKSVACSGAGTRDE